MPANWYDRIGSRKEFLSVAPGAAYIPHYLYHLVTGEMAVSRIGIAAALAVIVKASEAMTEVFFIVILFWLVDMILGMAKAIRDPSMEFRWSTAADGLLRLVVILTLPPVVSIATLIPEASWDIPLGDRPVVFTLGLMAMWEFWSILDNATFFMPPIARLKNYLVQMPKSDGS